MNRMVFTFGQMASKVLQITKALSGRFGNTLVKPTVALPAKYILGGLF